MPLNVTPIVPWPGKTVSPHRNSLGAPLWCDTEPNRA